MEKSDLDDLKKKLPKLHTVQGDDRFLYKLQESLKDDEVVNSALPINTDTASGHLLSTNKRFIIIKSRMLKRDVYINTIPYEKVKNIEYEYGLIVKRIEIHTEELTIDESIDSFACDKKDVIKFVEDIGFTNDLKISDKRYHKLDKYERKEWRRWVLIGLMFTFAILFPPSLIVSGIILYIQRSYFFPQNLKIELGYPINDIETEEALIEIKGRVNQKLVELKINDEKVILDEQNRFFKTVELTMGVNQFTIVAKSVIGEDRKYLKIKRVEK